MNNIELRNFRDLISLYHKITESCFVRCVNRLTERDLSQDETRCVDVCARKFVNVNRKVMQVYMEIQPQFVKRRMEEMNKLTEQATKAEKEKNAQEYNVTSGENEQTNAASV